MILDPVLCFPISLYTFPVLAFIVSKPFMAVSPTSVGNLCDPSANEHRNAVPSLALIRGIIPSPCRGAPWSQYRWCALRCSQLPHPFPETPFCRDLLAARSRSSGKSPSSEDIFEIRLRCCVLFVFVISVKLIVVFFVFIVI